MPTQPLNLSRTIQCLAVTGLLLLGSGCSLYKARKAYEAGRFQESVDRYHEILQSNPSNIKARIGYRRAAERASEQHLDAARLAQKHGQEELVEKEVRQAYRLDPSNAVAQDWIARIELASQRRQAQDEEESLEDQRMRANAKSPILLNPRTLEGMDLNFTRKTNLRDIFNAIAKNSGVSIILHSSVPQDISVSADLRGLTFQRILDTLMLQSDLFYKFIDTNTIMVFKYSTQNEQQYQSQLIQTFYLSNAVVDDLRTVFTTLMPQVRVVTDKRLNALTIKAKPTDLTIARRIVNQLDKAKAEVMVYMELLEVTETNLERVGLLPTIDATSNDGMYRIGAMLDTTTAGSSMINYNKGAIRISKSDVKFLFPSLALDALKSNGDAKLVASPNIRVVSGEEGLVNIGEKVSTTQSSIGIPNLGGTTGTTGTSSLSSSYGIGQTQFSYEDVGVNIKVKPRVHFNDDVTLEIDAQVTTLAASTNADRPNIGSRKIKTQARLKDGETAVFAGLLKEDEQKTLKGIWGLTDIPILGHLLGSNSRNRTKTDVILTIRAVLVRKADLDELDMEAFDPEQAASQSGPFTPKTIKKKTDADAAVTAPPTAPNAPSAAAAPTPGSAPAQNAKSPDSPKAPEAQAPANTASTAANPADAAAAATTPANGAAATTATPSDAQDLVLFLTPLTSSIKTNEHLQLTLMVSGGGGLANGYVELKLDPARLKVASINAGDFVVSEGGSVEQVVKPDGTVRINFRRATTASDSGTLATIELQALQAGNAPVLIQSGQYMVSGNPIPAKVVNALVTVE